MATRGVSFRFISCVALIAMLHAADPPASTTPAESSTTTTTTTTASTTPKQPTKRNLKVLTLLDPPFVMHTDRGEDFRGFAVEVLREATPKLGYDDFDLKIHNDARFGAEEYPGIFNGIVGAVQNKSADMAVGAFTITSKRSQAVEFSQPLITGGYRALYKIPDSWHPGEAMVTLLRPFSPGLWVLIVFMFVLASLALYIIGRFSPYEDIAFVGKTSTYDGLTLQNSFLYTFSTLVWQGYTAAPKSISGRVLISVWWVFAVMTVAAYIAGLCVLLFRVNPEIRTLPFTTFDELSRQNKVGLMVVANTSAHRYLTISERAVEKRLLALIKLHEEDLFVGHVEEAIQKMIDSDGKLVLLMEASAAEYLTTQEPCNKMVIGETLGEHSIGFICRNDINLCGNISTEVLRMKEDGTIDKLKEKYFGGGCLKDSGKSYVFEGLPFFDTFGGEPDAIMPLTITIKRFSVAFILLVIGIALAGIALLVEIYYAKRRGTAVPQRLQRDGHDDDARAIGTDFHDDDRA
ncbi:unnamed protein product [Lymnaea stagnalis]|uniref:Uncharacterized protein n=1 Tax=Lymnaea stagnalis TaxID=6523 RepID=A0AAV2HKH4_LYMST